MARHQNPWGKQTRQRIAVEAARIMAEEQLSDFAKARRKAAERLGLTLRNDMPTNQEIEVELRSYRALFTKASTQSSLRKQRDAALEAMQFFARFKPRLVGSVLDGTASAYEPVRLHLFSDLLEDVVLFFMEKGIEFDQSEVKVRYKSGVVQHVPVLEFQAGDIPFELLIFSATDIRQAPLCSVSGEVMKRADAEALKTIGASDS